MTRQRNESVVRRGRDRHWDGPEPGYERVERLVALGPRLVDRREKPGSAAEQLGGRVLRAAGFRAGHRVPADEPIAIAEGLAYSALGRADVGHGAIRPTHPKCRNDLRRELSDGSRYEREISASHGLGKRRRSLRQRLALERTRESVAIGIPASHGTDTGSLRGKADRGSDQPRTDDREMFDARQVRRSCSSRRSAGA